MASNNSLTEVLNDILIEAGYAELVTKLTEDQISKTENKLIRASEVYNDEKNYMGRL